MSMIGLFRRIPAANCASLTRNPGKVRELTSAPPQMKLPPAAIEKLKNATEEEWAKLPEPMRTNLQRMLREAGAQQVPAVVSVEKMWQALHFLVAGNAFEPGPGKAACVLGGEPCGPDAGYGPARLLSPEEVAAIARELPSPEQLRAAFDPEKLRAADVYPGVWDEDPEDLWDELSTYYALLFAMYREAAAAGDAVLAWIS